MDAVTTPSKRSQNFSMNDCLLLAELMGEESGSLNISRHKYLRHRFTTTITAASKKRLWDTIASMFAIKAVVPRDALALKKKWDNLVQTHRSLYSDYKRSQQLTGGGPQGKCLSLLTEAVMTVVGKESTSIQGIVGPAMDSSLMLANSVIGSSSNNTVIEVDQAVPSATNVPIARNEESMFDETWLQSCDTGMSMQQEECHNVQVQVVSCNCQCHKKNELLKTEKLRLQIKLLKRQLGEE